VFPLPNTSFFSIGPLRRVGRSSCCTVNLVTDLRDIRVIVVDTDLHGIRVIMGDTDLHDIIRNPHIDVIVADLKEG
jgi:hypothetical protein